MIIDFAKNYVDKVPITVNSENDEIVSEYKYLGTIIDDKLKGSLHVERVCKKANQRLCFVKKLEDVNMDGTVIN